MESKSINSSLKKNDLKLYRSIKKYVGMISEPMVETRFLFDEINNGFIIEFDEPIKKLRPSSHQYVENTIVHTYLFSHDEPKTLPLPPLNLYGDDENYRSLPMIGNTMKKGVLFATCHGHGPGVPPDNNDMQEKIYEKWYTAGGIIYDINIRTEGYRVEKASVNSQIYEYYCELINYYREIIQTYDEIRKTGSNILDEPCRCQLSLEKYCKFIIDKYPTLMSKVEIQLSMYSKIDRRQQQKEIDEMKQLDDQLYYNMYKVE